MKICNIWDIIIIKEINWIVIKLVMIGSLQLCVKCSHYETLYVKIILISRHR
jgi:hypothetical protein